MYYLYLYPGRCPGLLQFEPVGLAEFIPNNLCCHRVGLAEFIPNNLCCHRVGLAEFVPQTKSCGSSDGVETTLTLRYTHKFQGSFVRTFTGLSEGPISAHVKAIAIKAVVPDQIITSFHT